jgi:hypothetical protein
VFLIGELLLNLMGWIPVVGISLLGLSLNLNTLISILLLFIFVIILFSKFMMPAHVVHDHQYETNLSSSIRFLGVIGQKFLRYLFAHIPGAIFSVILIIIPSLIIGIAVFLSIELKNSVIESRISLLNDQLYIAEENEKFELQNRIDRMEYFLDFPQLVFGDFTGLKDRIAIRDNLSQNLDIARKQQTEYQGNFEMEIDSLENLLSILQSESDTTQMANVLYLESLLEKRKDDFNVWKARITMDIVRLSSDLKFENNMIAQLPIAFVLIIIWLSLFGGLVVAVLVSYLGNVYHELYAFKEDDSPSFFRKEAERLNEKDRNQPLLGFTLLAILIVFVFAEWRLGIISGFPSIF